MPAFSSEERQLLQDSLEGFFQSQYPFERFRELSNPAHATGFDPAAWQEYGQLGWLGVALPEEAGGTDCGMTELAIVMAAAGSALALEPLLPTVVLGASAIALAGTASQRSQLSEVSAGNLTLAFCHTEPDAGYARHYVKTVARTSPGAGGYVLSGRKSFSLHAQAADRLIVSARLEDENGPMALFAIPSDASGLEFHHAQSLDERRGAAVDLNQVEVTADALLGESSEDRAAVIDEIIDRGVIAVCAEAAGAMATATEQTVEYLKTREQFGQPLSRFQVLQHRLVDMSVAAEEARAATHGALRAMDGADPDAQTKVWRAKVQTARSARYVGAQAIQLHGGMGMTDDLAIGHYYKRLCLCETLFGDGEWYLRQLGARAHA